MTESVFNTAYGIWNSLVSLAMTLFTTSPTAANSSVYSTCRLMYNAITDISLPIAIVFPDCNLQGCGIVSTGSAG